MGEACFHASLLVCALENEPEIGCSEECVVLLWNYSYTEHNPSGPAVGKPLKTYEIPTTHFWCAFVVLLVVLCAIVDTQHFNQHLVCVPSGREAIRACCRGQARASGPLLRRVAAGPGSTCWAREVRGLTMDFLESFFFIEAA